MSPPNSLHNSVNPPPPIPEADPVSDPDLRTSSMHKPDATAAPAAPVVSMRSPFFLATLFLAVTSWFISLISQAIVRAQIGNVPVGVLWFAIILQLALIICLSLSLITFSLPTYRITLSQLASITTVLASIGVNDNIYSPIASQKATAAGWLITAIVDLLWVIHLSAGEDSFIRRTLDGVPATGNASSTGGFRLRAPPVFAGRLRKTRPPSTAQNPGGDKQTTEGAGEQLAMQPVGGPANGGAPGALDVPRRRSAAATSNALSGVTNRTSATGSANYGGSSASGDAPVGSSRPGSDALKARVKAQALYSYDGSETDPNELSFVKGEFFDIVDRTGKWWEAVKPNGTVGSE
ncbi:hypothetical protein AMATHDRAFT_4851 [Amanita thiersii Skay4041]|uniref:SH3 domain-containing protein n=1 Tax=Amanita thiersii Skay4041 TaxID=703135 RepID=A0A2A9NFW8_9AGAR|nr:hypothetical protein AMATHDRAFT_4851 [Amanita thiersii Skay4041]